MIRHVGLLLLEALCALGLHVLGGLRPPPAKRPHLAFSLTALGEREREDGSWEGFDLLAAGEREIDRFQLTLRPERDARLTVDARTADGWQRLFPSPGADGRLRAGVSYALPSPASFYRLEGNVTLRVTVSPIAPGTFAEAAPVSSDWKAGAILPLSDGSRFPLFEYGFDALHAARVELALQGRPAP